MTSIFTKIINGEIPCHKVAENEDFIAFLDVNPNAVGHTLVVPKQEVDKLFDLDKNTYAGLMEFSRSLAIALEKAVPCERIGMSVIGLEVSHVHIHLIPLNAMADIQFQKKVSLSKEEFERVAKSISAHLS